MQIHSHPREAAAGFVIERRGFFALSAAAAAALWNASASAGGSDAKAASAGRLSWEAFARETQAILRAEPISAGVVEEACLMKIAALAVRLEGLPATRLFPFDGADPKIEFGPVEPGLAFFAIEWRMEPHAILSPHNHPNYAICTLGLDGEARIENYEVVGTAPAFDSKERFRVRRTHDEVLSAGRINTLSSTRDNVHALRAGRDGARGVDIGVQVGPDVGFAFLSIDEKPHDEPARIFDATWRKS